MRWCPVCGRRMIALRCFECDQVTLNVPKHKGRKRRRYKLGDLAKQTERESRGAKQ